jgi:mxaJ protein
LLPVLPENDQLSLPFVFDISIGVRRGNTSLKKKLDGALIRRRSEIRDVLRSYGVPVVGAAK